MRQQKSTKGGFLNSKAMKKVPDGDSRIKTDVRWRIGYMEFYILAGRRRRARERPNAPAY
jgi:hypothetical protein